MTTRSTTRSGRPTLLTPVVIEKLGQAVEQGLTRAQAAEVAGVNAGSFARWMTRGRAADQRFDDEGSIPVEEGPYWELYARIRKADVIRRAVKTASEVPEPAPEAPEKPDALPTRSIPLTFRWSLVRIDQYDLGMTRHWYRDFGAGRPRRFSVGGWRSGRTVPVSTGWMLGNRVGEPRRINGVSVTVASRTLYLVRLYTRAAQRAAPLLPASAGPLAKEAMTQPV